VDGIDFFLQDQTPSRSIVSFGFVSSSITTRTCAGNAAILVHPLVAHCTGRMPHSPAVPAAPDRGAMIPIRSGLFCAKAGANSRGAAAAREARTRKSGKNRDA